MKITKIHISTRAARALVMVSLSPLWWPRLWGGWGSSTVKVFIEFAKTKSLMTSNPKNKILSHFYQSLCLMSHKENARAIIRRCSVTREALLKSVAAEDAP